MRVTVLHGYYLHDSGSGIYVRELARALVQLGHEVTLVCQEREPQRYDFIDSAYALDAVNSVLEKVHDAQKLYAGSCRLVRPNLGGTLLVYVKGPFPGFGPDDVTAFQDAPAEVRDAYVAANVAALRTVLAAWPTDRLLAQHLIMQPFVARAALAASAPYIVTEHGSALNFCVRTCGDLLPFALAGLADAAAVVTVSTGAQADLTAWAAEHGLDIEAKSVALPPGIDADVFAPAGARTDALDAMRRRITLPEGFDVCEDDAVIAFAGAVLNTKGLQHAVAALPLIARSRGRRLRLLVAGTGPARAALEQLSALTAAGDVDAARDAVADDPQLQSPAPWGDVVVDAPPLPDGPSVAFLGHLDHAQLASVFAAADVALVPSVFPEAAALVNSEALMSGALPLASYHSGMVALADSLATVLCDDVFTSLVPDGHHAERVAQAVVHILDTYPTADPAFRARVRGIGLRLYPTWQDTAAAYLELTATAGA